MLQELTTVTIVIPDYDQAIAWYTTVLGFQLIEDIPQASGKRWVVIAPAAARTSRILLARATSERQLAAIGNQTGGRVGFFLTSDDFQGDFRDFSSRGVQFLENPRQESYGWVVQFADPWGNKYDLLEAKTPTTQSEVPATPQNEAITFTSRQSEASALSTPHSEAIAALPSVNQAAKPSATADARSETQRAARHSGGYVSNGVGFATKQLPNNRLRRYGFVGVIIPHALNHGPEIQRILSEHADLIQGRMGLPHLEDDTLAVITLIVCGTPEDLGSLTGRLGRLKGVTVKSGLAPLKDEV